MTVERTHANHQTRYALDAGAGLSCVLTYTAAADDPATWKILLPGPGGTEDLYGTQRIATPDAGRLRAWLTPIIGPATPPNSPPPSMPRRHRRRPGESTTATTTDRVAQAACRDRKFRWYACGVTWLIRWKCVRI